MYERICIYHVLFEICIYTRKYAACGDRTLQQESMQIYVLCTYMLRCTFE